MKSIKHPKIILLIICIAFVIGVRFLGLDNYINFSSLQERREDRLLFVDLHYTTSVLLFVLLYMAIVAASLPLAAVMTVTGGFLYGIFWGAVYANIGATIGAVIAFLITRYLLGDYIQQKYAKQLARFNREFDQYGTLYLLFVHLIAFIPFFIVNIAAALTTVSLWTFVWTTSVGIFPGAFIYTYAGQELQTISSIRDIFTPQMIIMRVRKNGT